MDNLDLSIIIPVYNGSQHIVATLKPLLKLDNIDFEVVIVNDGSTDETWELLEEFRVCKKVLLIDSINKGVSSARNLGLANSTGSYVLFLDSDDHLDLDVLQKSILSLNDDGKPELIIHSFTKGLKSSASINYSHNLTGWYSSDFVLKQYFVRSLKFHLGSMLFSREFLVKNGITFDVGIKYGEDIKFYIISIYVAERVLMVDKLLHTYSYNETSVMNIKPNLDRFDALYSVLSIYPRIKNTSYFFKVYYQVFCMSIFIKTLRLLLNESGNDEYRFHFKRYKKSINKIVFSPVLCFGYRCCEFIARYARSRNA